jgi:hypothetical protein
MREELGFETPEQYMHAQQTGAGQVAKEGWVGPLSGGQASVKAAATEHGISEKEAQRLITLAWETKGKAPELANLTDAQRRSLIQAGLGYDPWVIAPTSVASGDIPGIAPTREQQAQIEKDLRAAEAILKEANLATGSLDKGLAIKTEAYTSDDPKVQQAVRDIVRGEKAYKTVRATQQALGGTVPAEKINVHGLGKEVVGKVYDLAKLRSAKVIEPSVGAPGMFDINISKAIDLKYDATKLGNLGFLVDKNLFGQAQKEREQYLQSQKVTEKDLQNEQAALEALEPYATGRTMKDEYPTGGAPFESYETAPKTYSLVLALHDKIPESTLLAAKFTPEQITKAKADLKQYESLLSAQDIVSGYYDKSGNISYYGLRKSIEKGVTDDQLKALGFTQKVIDTAKLPPPQEAFLAEYAEFNPKPDVMTKHRGALTPSEETKLHQVEPVWYAEAAAEYNKLYKETTPLPKSHLLTLPETGVTSMEPISISPYTMAALRQLPAKFGITTPTKLAEPTMGLETVEWWEPPKDIAVA